MRTRELIRADYLRYRAGSSSVLGVVQRHGFWAGLSYRISHHLLHTPPSWCPRVVRSAAILLLGKLAVFLCNMEIPARCEIGPGLALRHFGPVVIHPDVRIGADCTIGHSVTIGIGGRGDRRGTPVLGDGVWVGPHSITFGPLAIGDDAAIGAGAVVVADVPDHAVVVGNPARVVSHAGASALRDAGDEG